MSMHWEAFTLLLILRPTINLMGGNVTVSDLCEDPDPFLMPGLFPQDFLWGIASSSYQTEGAWNTSGKGASIWDTQCHMHPESIAGNASGDIASDSYHKWPEDIALLKNLGVTHYRFSISWPRLLPTGQLADKINLDGVRFYRDMINSLTAHKIAPMVTLYHWDLPQALQDKGGWLNESSIDWFLGYADLCFRLFGHKVPYWVTINEPLSQVWKGYGIGFQAPQISHCPGTCPYIAAHNMLRAHARVWHHYDLNYRARQKGKVGIALNGLFPIPKTDKADDKTAADRYLQFNLGWFANPIFGSGDYPSVMKKIIGARSLSEGLHVSRLPEFTEIEKYMLKGSADFLGFNFYISTVVENAPNNPTELSKPSWEADEQVKAETCKSRRSDGSSSIKPTPWGLRGILNWIRTQYHNPKVIITENGWGGTNPTIEDNDRVNFLEKHINNIIKSVILDGCKVAGYTAWSLLDSFEWTSGYKVKFGLHFVNFSDPKRERIPKKSAEAFAKIVSVNGF